MYNTLKAVHSYWAYFVLIILIIAVVNALMKAFGDREYSAKDFRLSLFTLIVSHIQLLVGIIAWISANYFKDLSVGDIMSNSILRSNIIEHPLTMIVAVTLITIGYSKHKKKLTSKGKFKIISIFYTIALFLVLVKIPWNIWLS